MAAGVFRVELGINDTALTRALEIGDNRTAAVIITEVAAQQDAAMLDEGPYERIPLYIVLCGYDVDGSESCRNLYMAKLLIENGANPNKRFPIYSLGVMVYTTVLSHSPMELLLMFYSECAQIAASGQWSSKQPSIVGLDRQTKYSFWELKQQLLQLIDLFIAHGAEVDVYYRSSKPMMNYLLQSSPDVDLIQRLCDAGAAVNSLSDSHGSTPIMALCSSSQRGDRWEEVMHYFLNQIDIELNLQDCQGHNVLWKALSQGNFELARLLVNTGASLAASGYAYFPASAYLCDSSVFLAAEVPTLLAATVGMFRPSSLSNKCCCTKWHRRHLHPNGNSMLMGTAAIVDRGLPLSVLLDVEDSIGATFPWDKGIRQCWTAVSSSWGKGTIANGLLGHLAVSLRQLCVRTVLRVVVHNFLHLESQEDNSWDGGSDSAEPSPPGDGEATKSDARCASCAAVFRLQSECLPGLLETLKLPTAFLKLFHMELYRWKLITALGHGQHSRVPCACSETESFLEVSDSESSTVDDASEVSHL